jgi:hypothetical protein
VPGDVACCEPRSVASSRVRASSEQNGHNGFMTVLRSIEQSRIAVIVGGIHVSADV